MMFSGAEFWGEALPGQGGLLSRVCVCVWARACVCAHVHVFFWRALTDTAAAYAALPGSQGQLLYHLGPPRPKDTPHLSTPLHTASL